MLKRSYQVIIIVKHDRLESRHLFYYRQKLRESGVNSTQLALFRIIAHDGITSHTRYTFSFTCQICCSMKNCPLQLFKAGAERDSFLSQPSLNHCCQIARRLLCHFVKKIPLFGEKILPPFFWSKLGSKTRFLVKFFYSTHVLFRKIVNLILKYVKKLLIYLQNLKIK